jgi:phosphoenolpyruvate synthase/pyruvate phosphate dikinase
MNLKKVAVRSSAVCEDGKNNSYAGQFETFLNVDRCNLIDSIKKCFKSNEADNIKGYIEEKNIINDNTNVSVIVQEMIDGEISGVMFTCSPITQENEIIIEFVYGLGEKLVQGEETPIQIIVNKDTFEIKINYKRGQDITYKEEKKFKELAEIGIEIEKIYRMPQDIEWTIKNNEIFILQTRNITNIK